DLIFIQEPYLDFNKLTRATPYWHVIYPRLHHDNAERTQSVILVNKHISTNAWTAIDIASPDITGLTMETHHGNFHLFNVY
ncbi:hypothetical protein OBBRIDRAFT_689874, partial [Obba rivulosa]